MNEPVSKEEFDEKSRSSGSHKNSEAFRKYRELVEKEAIHKFMEGEKNENSTGISARMQNAHDVFYEWELKT